MTASRFKAAVCTDLTQPSQSLLKTICYPESYKFSNAATRWGCEHEKSARDAYVAKVAVNHRNFTVNDRRLVIHPHFGPSPDGFVKCDCCGCGVIEVKCPFSCRDRSFLEASKWYTRVPLTSPDMQLPMQESSSSSEPTQTPQTSTEQKWRYCNGDESGNMTGCENDDCAIQWFHIECLRIKRIPKKAWYCPDCRKGKHLTKRTACIISC